MTPVQNHRVPGVTRHIPYLDGWRGIAIIAVLYCHFGNRDYANIGAFGVMMFFVLSGFLMSQLLFVKRVAFVDFMLRRCSRILPTFWLFILVIWGYARWLQPLPFDVAGPELLATLSFLRTYFPSAASIWAEQWPIGHIWSLNVEEHSYLFLALAAALVRRTPWRWSELVLLGASTMAVFGTALFYGAVSSPAGAAPWFIRSECASLGLLAAACLKVARTQLLEPSRIGNRSWIPLLAFAAGILCFITPLVPKGADKLIGPLMLAVSICYLDNAPQWCHRFLSWNIFRWFGTCSFSLYLWQHPFFVATQHFGLNSAVGFAGALLVGSASFYFFENPVRIRINAALGARARVGAAEVPVA